MRLVATQMHNITYLIRSVISLYYYLVSEVFTNIRRMPLNFVKFNIPSIAMFCRRMRIQRVRWSHMNQTDIPVLTSSLIKGFPKERVKTAVLMKRVVIKKSLKEKKRSPHQTMSQEHLFTKMRHAI